LPIRSALLSFSSRRWSRSTIFAESTLPAWMRLMAWEVSICLNWFGAKAFAERSRMTTAAITQIAGPRVSRLRFMPVRYLGPTWPRPSCSYSLE
jgi:hypothetical protein